MGARFINVSQQSGIITISTINTKISETFLSQVAQTVARIPDRNTRQEIAAYTEILAGLKFEKDFIRQLSRLALKIVIGGSE